MTYLFRPIPYDYDWNEIEDAYTIEGQDGRELYEGEDPALTDEEFEKKYNSWWQVTIRDFEGDMRDLCQDPDENFTEVEDIDDNKDGLYVKKRNRECFSVVHDGGLVIELDDGEID